MNKDNTNALLDKVENTALPHCVGSRRYVYCVDRLGDIG